MKLSDLHLDDSFSSGGNNVSQLNDCPVIRARHLFVLLASYLILHLLSRILISDSANLDEAEQLILTQGLRWGYGSQPPLYTWLQFLAFTVFGTNIFALALLKNVLIFTTYLFTYLTAKQISRRNTVALLAMCGLLFVPQIAWESQRDLTHSVLATSVASATLFFFVKLLQTRKTRFYMLVGLCAALGILSKYNYALCFPALTLAALSLAEFRAALLDKKALLMIAIFFLITTPHFHWAVRHPENAFVQSPKLRVAGAVNTLALYLKGLSSLATASLAFLLPLLLVNLSIFKRAAILQSFQPKSEYEKWIFRMVLIGLLFCVAMVLCFKARFKDRWMQPLLFVVPLYFSLRLKDWLNTQKIKRFCALSGIVAVCVLIVLPSDTLTGPLTRHYTRLNSPFSAMIGQIKAQFSSGSIIAEDRLLGGNFRLGFPDSHIVAPELAAFPLSENETQLLVWDAPQKREMPRSLAKLASKILGADLSQWKIQYVEAPYKYSAQDSMRLGFILIPPTQR